MAVTKADEYLQSYLATILFVLQHTLTNVSSPHVPDQGMKIHILPYTHSYPLKRVYLVTQYYLP